MTGISNKISVIETIKALRNSLFSFLRRSRKMALNRKLPFKGYVPSPSTVKYVDILDDEDLAELNNMLDWNCFTSDIHGRRFGMAAWGSKRDAPETIPDRRIVMMHDRFDLTDKHVLEVGCFEGTHSLGLLHYSRKVTAVDARIDHVVKTIVRCAMFGYSPTVFKYDIESIPADVSLLQADLIHHVGVLYHLSDPVGHLIDLGRYIKQGVMLDTHYCLPNETTGTYPVQGKEYSYKRYLEYGKKEAFSGMYDHSKWLLLADIVACLQKTGFDYVEIIEERQERNGPRVLLFASRT
jgi:tRNA (mo5U34)-methyltransferase